VPEGLLTPDEQNRGMFWLITGNGLSTILVDTNFYGNFFMLFLAELKLDTGKIGSILSLLSLCGMLSLVLAPTVARVGYRRGWLFYAWFRLIFAALLLAAPLTEHRWGGGAAFALVALCVVGFGFSRAVGDTSILPWSQVLIPDPKRGRFNAVTLIVQQLCKLLTVLALGVLIAQRAGLRPYMQAIACGLIVGVAACWSYARMPGGQPMRRQPAAADTEAAHGVTASSVPSFKSMWATVRVDRSFALYLTGMVVTIVAQCMLGSFVPLFLKDVARMPSSRVIWLDAAGMVGGLGTSYLWGWCADRFGSKPMMLLSAMAFLSIPVLNILAEWQLFFGVLGAVAMGLSYAGWNITLVRFLYTNAMPPQKAPSYTAVYNAIFGLSGAIGPFVAGQFLRIVNTDHASASASASASPSSLAATYHLLFICGSIVLAAGLSILAFTKAKDDLSVWQVIRLLARGGIPTREAVDALRTPTELAATARPRA
jgi:MFS family permease